MNFLSTSLPVMVLFIALLHCRSDAQNWQPGNGPYGGRIFTLMREPATGDLYAGTYYAGIYRSTDNGTTWTYINGTLRVDAINSMLPISPSTFLAGGNLGVYRSTDAGYTWVQVNTGIATSKKNVRALTRTPNGNVFAATNAAIYRSTDNGDSWTDVSNGPGTFNIYDLVSRSNGDLFAAMYNFGVYRSTDNGDSWTTVNGGLPGLRASRLLFRKNGALVAAIDAQGVFQSTDSGASWSDLGAPQRVYTAVAENDAEDLFAGISSYGVHRKLNNSGTWTEQNTGLSCDDIRFIHCINSLDILVCLQGGLGIQRSSDNGDSWHRSNEGLSCHRVLCLTPAYGSTIFAGSDGGGIQYTTNNGDSWNAILNEFSSISMEAIAVNSAGHLFAGGGNGVYKSVDSGKTWTHASNLLSTYIVAALVINASDHLFAASSGGIQGISRSTDAGDNWKRSDSGMAHKSVYALLVLPNGDLLAGTYGGGIYRSTDNGNFWFQSNSGLGNMNVYELYYHPSGMILAGHAGGGSRSVDNGQTWTDLALPSRIFWAFSHLGTGHIFAGGWKDGVYHSTDNGNQWTPAQSGLDNMDIRALLVDAVNYLHAATAGSSSLRSTFPVPVELLSFDAHLVETRVRLRWITAAETNLHGFEVERRTAFGGGPSPAPDWATVGFIAGSGTSSARGIYEFTDDIRSLDAGGTRRIFYRLKQVDTDGTFDYSPAVSVDLFDTPLEARLERNSPNPFKARTAISFEVVRESPVTLEVYDLFGRRVATLAREVLAPGSYNRTFTAPATAPPGQYYSVLSTPEATSVMKMILLR